MKARWILAMLRWTAVGGLVLGHGICLARAADGEACTVPEALAPATGIDTQLFQTSLPALENAAGAKDCGQLLPEYGDGVAGCEKNRAAWNRYQQRCWDFLSVRQADHPMTAVLRREEFKLLFDRELILIHRLPPNGEGAKLWDAFKKKWEARWNADPELRQFDDSPLLRPEERGRVANRIRTIDTFRERTIRDLQTMGTGFASSPGPGFYMATAALLNTVLASKYTEGRAWAMAKQNFLDQHVHLEAAKIQKEADRMIATERDVLFQIYPELEISEGERVLIESRLKLAGWPRYKLSDFYTAPDENGAIPSFEVRFNKMLRLLDDLRRKDPALDAALKSYNESLVRGTEKILQRFDQQFQQSKSFPNLTHQDSLSLLALNALGKDASVEPLRQSILGHLCYLYNSDKDLERVRKRLSAIGEVASDASWVALGAGTLLNLGSRAALRLAPAALRALTAGSRAGSKLLTASGFLVVGASPGALAELQDSISLYNRRLDEFYKGQGVGKNTGISQVELAKTAAQLSGANTLMTLSPLLFF